MKNKRLIGFFGLLLVALGLLACDTGNLVAMINPPTETPTRTPRPTFTPRPAATDTPEDTPTSVATDTPDASPTPTKRPTAHPATPKPVVTTAPPPPQFAWTVKSNDSEHGFCPTGSAVFEVEGRVWSGSYIGGIHVVALDKDSKVIAQTDSLFPEQQNLEFGVSCFGNTLPSYKLDVTAGWSNGPIIIRLTKSAADLTPISPDASITFTSAGGRYYIDFVK